MWVSECVVHGHWCARRCKCAWAHTHRSPEDAGYPALSFSTALRWGLLPELDWQPPSPSFSVPDSHGNEVTGYAWLFTSVLGSELRDSHFPTHVLFLFTESSFPPQDRDIFEGRNNSVMHSLLFYPSPSYKWFILHYFFQHEACVSAMILNRCFDFSICDHAAVLQILA